MARSELGGMPVQAAVGAGAGGLAAGGPQMSERPRGTMVHELPVEGNVLAGPVQRRIPRKQPAARDTVREDAGGEDGRVSEDDAGDMLSPSKGGYRPVSTISHAEEPAEVPLPRSPISPT